MKKWFLSIFFAVYFIFIPFVWMACSVGDDTQYVKVSANQSESEVLEDCESQEFLTADCVEVVNEENERLQEEQAAVIAAFGQVEDFEGCYLYEASESASEESTETETVDACTESVNAMLSGYEYCIAIPEGEKYFECSDIEIAVEDAVSLCDLSSSQVTRDFCALVNPTVDAES